MDYIFPEGYYLVEMLGHQVHVGYTREVSVAGAGLLEVRCDLNPHATPYTKLVSPNSLYALSPMSDEDVERWRARYSPPQLVAGDEEEVEEYDPLSFE